MRYFIGISVPQIYKTKVEIIRAQFKFFTTEPHITLVSPNLLPNSDSFIKNLIKTCKSINNIEIKLCDLHQFGDKILFTRVDSPDLKCLYASLHENLDLYKEKTNFTPHLTLVKQRTGRKPIDLFAIKKKAESILPLHFGYAVKSIVVYKQPEEQSIYIPYMKIPLENLTQI